MMISVSSFSFVTWESRCYQTCNLLHDSHNLLSLHICSICLLLVCVFLCCLFFAPFTSPCFTDKHFISCCIPSLLDLIKLKHKRRKIQGSTSPFKYLPMTSFHFFKYRWANISDIYQIYRLYI